MKVQNRFRLSRRALFAALTVVPITVACLGLTAQAQDDPLPSWNDGEAKKAILNFVAATSQEGSPTFVPPAERIATFDQDGTLWVEHPMYTPGDLLPGAGPGLGYREAGAQGQSSRSRRCCPGTARRWPGSR